MESVKDAFNLLIQLWSAPSAAVLVTSVLSALIATQFLRFACSPLNPHDTRLVKITIVLLVTVALLPRIIYTVALNRFISENGVLWLLTSNYFISLTQIPFSVGIAYWVGRSAFDFHALTRRDRRFNVNMSQRHVSTRVAVWLRLYIKPAAFMIGITFILMHFSPSVGEGNFRTLYPSLSAYFAASRSPATTAGLLVALVGAFVVSLVLFPWIITTVAEGASSSILRFAPSGNRITGIGRDILLRWTGLFPSVVVAIFGLLMPIQLLIGRLMDTGVMPTNDLSPALLLFGKLNAPFLPAAMAVLFIGTLSWFVSIALAPGTRTQKNSYRLTPVGFCLRIVMIVFALLPTGLYGQIAVASGVGSPTLLTCAWVFINGIALWSLILLLRFDGGSKQAYKNLVSIGTKRAATAFLYNERGPLIICGSIIVMWFWLDHGFRATIGMGSASVWDGLSEVHQYWSQAQAGLALLVIATLFLMVYFLQSSERQGVSGE